MRSKRNSPQIARTRESQPAVQPQQQFIERRQEYKGLIPPPVILQQFDDLIPGTAARIIQWAEEEQAHRQRMEREAQQANIRAQERQLDIAQKQTTSVFRSDMIGQVLGFVVCLACVAGAVVLAIKGQSWPAVALAAIPTAAVVHAFRAGIFSKPPGKR